MLSSNLSKASQSKVQINVQKQIVDQNYANNILFMLLSVFEEVQIRMCKGQGKKRFAYYDKVDYSSKSFQELKSQIQVTLMILKASKMSFQMEYGKTAYKLPARFDEAEVIRQITKFLVIFKDKDKDFQKLAEDFLNIMENRLENLYFQTKSFTVNYSQQEKKKHQKKIFKNGLQAAESMDREKERVENLNVKNPQDLPVYLYEERPKQIQPKKEKEETGILETIKNWIPFF